MKILHVTKKYPNALAGDAVVVANLQKRQQVHGHQVVVLTSNCSEIKNGAGIYKFGLKDTAEALDQITARRLVSLLGLFWRSFTIIGRERPDVVHSHSVDMAFVVSLAARLYRVPIIHTFHIVTFYDPNQSTLRRKTELWLARNSRPKMITAPNDSDVARLINAGLDQAVLLPNGVDLDFWRPNPSAKKRNAFTFLSVGRLETQKGFDYLIRAVALLSQELPIKFELIIIGIGSQEPALKQLVKSLDLQEQVKFVGQLPAEKVRELFWASNVAVFASLYETTPLTLLEAWACGTPVVTTRVGLLSGQQISKSAKLVPVADAQALMQALKWCVEHPSATQQMAKFGLEEVNNFAWPSVGRQAQTIYGAAL